MILMNPQERDLINGLFDRLRQAEGQPRDNEADALIRDRLTQQGAAAYALTQTAIIQEHTINALQSRIQELEAKLAEPAPQQGGFLSGLFGGGAAAPQPRPVAQAPAAGPWGGAPQAQQPQPGPWGGAPQAAAPAGGGFLATAAKTAVGVAGGMLVANAISGMFNHGGSGGSQSLFGNSGSQGMLGGGDSRSDGFSQIAPGGSTPAYDDGGDYASDSDGFVDDNYSDDSGDYA
jgi:hypothetical protein